MKLEMKKVFLLFVLIFSYNVSYSQCGGTPPPPPECACEECCDLLGQDPVTCEFTVETPAYESCADQTGCTTVPIDSSILLLILSAVSFGIYKVNENKKRQLEN